MSDRLAEVDPAIEQLYLNEEEPNAEQLQQAIRRATVARTFVPVLMGSAFKNKGCVNHSCTHYFFFFSIHTALFICTGVQLLLDAVINYLPNPTEK